VHELSSCRAQAALADEAATAADTDRAHTLTTQAEAKRQTGDLQVCRLHARVVCWICVRSLPACKSLELLSTRVHAPAPLLLAASFTEGYAHDECA